MKRFESIIDTAIKESISDIHITGEHLVVSRKQGDIQFHGSLKWTHQEVDDLTKKLLTPLQLEILRQKKSVDVSISTSNARLRVNVFTTVRGISIAVRILPGHIPTIEELNLHPSLHDISKIKFGLVLICGGTGKVRQRQLQPLSTTSTNLVRHILSRLKTQSSTAFNRENHSSSSVNSAPIRLLLNRGSSMCCAKMPMLSL